MVRKWDGCVFLACHNVAVYNPGSGVGPEMFGGGGGQTGWMMSVGGRPKLSIS